MIANQQQRTLEASDTVGLVPDSYRVGRTNGDRQGDRVASNPCTALIGAPQRRDLLAQLNSGQLLVVDRRRRNGLIIYKRYHAEFAGPGAAVGGLFDLECQQVVPVGDVALVYPESYEERQQAFTIRRHWIRLTEQLTANPIPLKRAQQILTQFGHYFDWQTVEDVPDEAFARLVGVLPRTVTMVRHAATQGRSPIAV
ncbi:hypothetical protein [Oxynema sp. CENA135]|uniref:hypothetical protein n=1 Tax=Oxynema sp. CENA135 TaxID=984206 RepID=UPI001F44FE6F|nr:hypothetical protein [Oxynema sp. CENA135]